MTNTLHAKNKKTLIYILVAAIGCALAFLFFGIQKHQTKLDPKDIKVTGTYLIPTKKINNFSLKMHDNINFTKENLQGKWSLVFFWFF